MQTFYEQASTDSYGSRVRICRIETLPFGVGHSSMAGKQYLTDQLGPAPTGRSGRATVTHTIFLTGALGRNLPLADETITPTHLPDRADYLRRSANFARAFATFGATTNWQ